ncbi:MAG: methyltransferase domain-containing protein [Pseudonocardiales bacterium]|nr:methyltransferase domain-containing protein [Pseudonocardiales bacterium]
MADWTVHAARLADELTEAGKLWSAPWQAAIRAVPRHELVPVHYQRERGTDRWISIDTAGDLELVYSNTALFVLPDGLSSSSMPALMTRMLEVLDIHDGHKVLEIGAGTGYNAALLSHRLGDRQVFAVDLEPTLIDVARERLAKIGYHPTLVATDGVNGLPDHAPYDRIIATCAVPAVPWSWVEQTRVGGLILADVTPAQQAGNLVLLRRTRDGAEGRFESTYGCFMAMRGVGETYGSSRPGPTRDRGRARSRDSTLDATRPWEHPVLWFLAHFQLPAGISFGLCGQDTSRPPTTTFLSAADGSWCEIDAPLPDGTSRVWEAGPHHLWRTIEDAHATWLTRGRPGWGRFGLTVRPAQQWVWLDSPDSDTRWALA